MKFYLFSASTLKCIFSVLVWKQKREKIDICVLEEMSMGYPGCRFPPHRGLFSKALSVSSRNVGGPSRGGSAAKVQERH